MPEHLCTLQDYRGNTMFLIQYSFIQLSSTKRRLTVTILHLFLFSEVLFVSPKFFGIVHVIISSIHVNLGLPFILWIFLHTVFSNMHKCEFPLNPLRKWPVNFMFFPYYVLSEIQFSMHPTSVLVTLNAGPLGSQNRSNKPIRHR